MKFSFFLLAFLFVNSSFAQVKRLDVVEIGFVEILFRDSAEVYVMMWDDFTFEYNENYSEIIIREGGSNKRYTYKAKNIEFVQFKNTNETVVLHRYKSPKGREHLLLSEAHVNGDYSIVQSPGFVSPVFYYLCYNGEVFSVLPTSNDDLLDFFACDELYEKYGNEAKSILSLEELITRLDLYLKHCLTPPTKEEKGSRKKRKKNR